MVLVLIALMASLFFYNALVSRRKGTAPGEAFRPEMITLFIDGVLKARVMPADLERTPRASFTEPERGKVLEGWLLKDVINLYSDGGQLSEGSEITVFGTGVKRGEKTATLAWKDILDPDAHVLLHRSQDGQSLKLVSTLEALDTRDEWVQGVRRIDINTKR